MKKYVLSFVLLVGAFFSFQSVAVAQCSMGSDEGCGSDARDELIQFVNCEIDNMTVPPNYNHPNCGWNSKYTLNFRYYVDGDGDISMDLLEDRISSWLDTTLGGTGGGRSISVSLPCNERSLNHGTLTVWLICN
ncbi:MAG: hypothetical protein AAFQ98_01525 [Bacteroidota bacterium]